MKKRKIQFESIIDLIDTEISKRKHKWTLSAINWMDFDDVAQIIRFHIYKKWVLYDSSKPLLPWVNRIISNQIKNIIRNNYGNYARPCLKCAAYVSDSSCRIYGDELSSCPLFLNWSMNKKNAYDIKMAFSIEDHPYEITTPCEEPIDINKSTQSLHQIMKKILKPIEWQVYELLYVRQKSEEQACKALKLKFDKKSKTGYNKQLRNIQKSIINKAKKVIYDGEVDL